MKLMKRLLALCAVLALLCACALAEEAHDHDENAVLAAVDGEAITLGRVEYYAYLLYYYGYTDAYPDYELALDYLIQQQIIRAHLKAAGYFDLSEEELSAYRNEAASEWESLLDEYVNAYLTEDSEEERATLREQAAAYYASTGTTQESIYEELMTVDAQERLEQDLLAGYEPTEEEILAVFNEYGAQYKDMYEDNVSMYEYYTQYMNYESWYVPEGYRAMIHILLGVDDALLDAYQTAQATVEELLAAEEADNAALDAAFKAADEAFSAVLASRQEDIDAISERLANGESFQALIAEYGEDPGMEDPDQLAEGYLVHRESILWDPAFVDAAFQPDMQKPGDVSRPVVGTYGIHILYYLRDVPGGLNMTDDIHAEIEEYLVETKLDAAYTSGYEQWEAEAEIVKNEELLAHLIEEAAAE